MKPDAGTMAQEEPRSGLRPRVLINMAMSLDGKAGPVHALRPEPFRMSRGSRDPARMRELRASVDAVVAGASNLRDDNPGLGLAPEERARRRSLGLSEPLRVVVTSHGRGLLPSLRVFQQELGGPCLLMHAGALDPALDTQLGPHVERVGFGGERIPIPALLERLSRRGCQRILLEGGGELNAQFLAARAVDELYLTVVPRIFGGVSTPLVIAGDGWMDGQIPDARLVSCEPMESELFLHYHFAW